jgi:diadenosine tetraphosphate (Ap4A) HIT family hydrolase
MLSIKSIPLPEYGTIASMEDSVFTKIIKGEIPQEIIYEDELCVVLMTRDPLTPGHCLVVPREQIDHLWDVTDELYLHLMEVAKKMALKMRQVYNYERIGLLVEGYGVPHAHVHVFGYEKPFEPTIIEHSQHGKIASPEQLKIEADKLRA